MLTEIKRTVVDKVPVGLYLVTFEPIYSAPCNPGEHDDCMTHGCMDNESDRIAEVDPVVTKVTRDNYRELTEDVRQRGTDWNTSGCEGDTHDLRPRLFKLRREAKAHAEYTVKRFDNPQPWESFVKLK